MCRQIHRSPGLFLPLDVLVSWFCQKFHFPTCGPFCLLSIAKSFLPNTFNLAFRQPASQASSQASSQAASQPGQPPPSKPSGFCVFCVFLLTGQRQANGMAEQSAFAAHCSGVEPVVLFFPASLQLRQPPDLHTFSTIFHFPPPGLSPAECQPRPKKILKGSGPGSVCGPNKQTILGCECSRSQHERSLVTFRICTAKKKDILLHLILYSIFLKQRIIVSS